MKLWINAPDLGAQNVEQIVQRVAELDLAGVSLINAGFSVEQAVALNDLLKENGKAIFLVDDVEIAKAIGCPNVLVESTPVYEDIAAETAELCDLYARDGLNVAIQGGLDLACTTPEALNAVCNEVAKDNLLFYFDLPRYLNVPNYEYRWPVFSAALNTFGPKVVAYTLSDCYSDGEKVIRTPVGKGESDYEYLIYLMHRVLPSANLLLIGTTGEDLEPAVRHLISCIKEFE